MSALVYGLRGGFFFFAFANSFLLVPIGFITRWFTHQAIKARRHSRRSRRARNLRTHIARAHLLRVFRNLPPAAAVLVDELDARQAARLALFSTGVN
jgi:hypothetical protein